MIRVLIGVLLLAWILGAGFRFGGDLIHLILVVVVLAVVYELITGRRAV